MNRQNATPEPESNSQYTDFAYWRSPVAILSDDDTSKNDFERGRVSKSGTDSSASGTSFPEDDDWSADDEAEPRDILSETENRRRRRLIALPSYAQRIETRTRETVRAREKGGETPVRRARRKFAIGT